MKSMMPLLMLTALVVAAAGLAANVAKADHHAENEPKAGPALRFKVNDIHNEEVDLAKYQGKVVLMVNVASKCGFTPQYEGLEKLHDEYAEKGLVVAGFPCNQFGGQEPLDEIGILEFCQETYNVEFPMFSKIDVNGDNAHPLYKYLTSEAAPVEDKGKVNWNFEKFLIDREGNVIARFRSRVTPQQIEEAIVKALGTEAAS